MSSKRYEIADEQWEQIKKLFPKAKTDHQLMFNGILWIARSGAAWRDLPERFGSRKTVYSRFCKWRDDETLVTIFYALNTDVDLKNFSIASTIKKPISIALALKRGCEC